MNIELGKKTRRGMELYEKNPYIVDASLNTNEGTKRRTLRNKDGSQLMITNPGTGEMIAPAGFWQTQEVDKTQFVKLYVNGVRAFRELTAAGGRIFEILYLEVQKAIGRDRIYLSFSNLPDEFSISQATFTRGMRELMDKKFVAPTAAIGWYWVNPDYMWNGDRLAYVKEYRLKRDDSSDTKYREQLEARGQMRIDSNSEAGEIL